MQDGSRPEGRGYRLTAAQRSEIVSSVRGCGNRSTEVAVKALLVQAAVPGWIKHQRLGPTTPDFYFPVERLALFVDGCLWHSCPRCGLGHRLRTDYWRAKLDRNRRRDNRTRRALRSTGISVVRVWEHEVASGRWLARLRRMLAARQ